MNVTKVAITVLALCVVPLAAEAQHRIGVLLPGSPDDREYERRLNALRQGLREAGYVEGRNIAIEPRWARERYDRFPDLARELVRLGVDVIVTDTTLAARAASQATRTIPIVMALSGDPVAAGLVSSLARPGGNITGLTLMIPELAPKRLEILKEVAPRVARVAVLLNPDSPFALLYRQEAERAAHALSVALHWFEVRDPAELEPRLRAVARWRADALFVFEDAILLPRGGRQIADFAIETRLPTMSGYRGLVDAGGLISYGPSFNDMFRQAAGFVSKILKGSNPATLPIEQPTKFELVINLKTAKALGLTISQSLLIWADEVIQ